MHAASSVTRNLLARLMPGGRVEGAIVVGLLGRGIGASRSPIMHEREGARLGLNYAYRLVDFDWLGLEDSALGEVISGAEALGFCGLNVTHPFKQSVIPFLDGLSPEAEAIGAVNTIVLKEGRRTGHNTDSWGFAESFRAEMSGCPLAQVLQLGAGGAGAAVAHALLELGAGRVAVFDTEAARAAELARRLGPRVDAVADLGSALRRAQGVVNATPVGMAKYPGLPFDGTLLSPDQWVAEVVYFPAETDLLRLARARGCRTLPGLGMAIGQAVRAFALFTGLQPDRAAMARHFAAGEALLT